MICGIDEVGRGCLAGPVMACAVAFHTEVPSGLRDSKKLSHRMRTSLDAVIRTNAHVSIGIASVEEIDRINILKATMLAMRRAFEGLPNHVRPMRVLVDGNKAPVLNTSASIETVIGGDDLVAEIAAASIVAKVARDSLMDELHLEHPWYDWTSNKGYGSPRHLVGIAQHGATTHHRMTFGPLRQARLDL